MPQVKPMMNERMDAVSPSPSRTCTPLFQWRSCPSANSKTDLQKSWSCCRPTYLPAALTVDPRRLAAEFLRAERRHLRQHQSGLRFVGSAWMRQVGQERLGIVSGE